MLNKSLQILRSGRINSKYRELCAFGLRYSNQILFSLRLDKSWKMKTKITLLKITCLVQIRTRRSQMRIYLLSANAKLITCWVRMRRRRWLPDFECTGFDSAKIWCLQQVGPWHRNPGINSIKLFLLVKSELVPSGETRRPK